MKYPLAAALALAMAPLALAQETVISDDGREVMLKEDGTWEFISDDRFATTRGGDRVRLRSDGSWEIVSGNAAAAVTPVVIAPQPAAPAGPMNWSLDDVVIETARGKKSATKKGSTKRTQTVFNLQLRLAESAAAANWALDNRTLRVTDSSGRDYTIVSISPGSGELAAGERADIAIRVDGSPHWFTTQYYEIRIDAAVAGSSEDVRLRRTLSTVIRRDVEELPE